MYSPNGTLDIGLFLYVLGGLSKSRNGVAQSFLRNMRGSLQKLGLCWLQLTAEDQLESQGIQGGLMGSQGTHGGPRDPRAQN